MVGDKVASGSLGGERAEEMNDGTIVVLAGWLAGWLEVLRKKGAKRCLSWWQGREKETGITSGTAYNSRVLFVFFEEHRLVVLTRPKSRDE